MLEYGFNYLITVLPVDLPRKRTKQSPKTVGLLIKHMHLFIYSPLFLLHPVGLLITKYSKNINRAMILFKKEGRITDIQTGDIFFY